MALLPFTVGVKPRRRADDLVVADSGEHGLDGKAALGPRSNLGPQDRTGLVGTVSGRRPLPPQMAVRQAAPLRVVGEQSREGLGVAPDQRLRGGAQLLDQRLVRHPRLADKFETRVLAGTFSGG